MSRAEYLQKYLSADPPAERKSKKRKRKGAQETVGLTIADDDVLGFSSKAEDDDEDGPATVVKTRGGGEFRKSTTSKWKTVGKAAPTNAEQQAADAMFEAARAERAALAAENEEAPAVVVDTGSGDTPMMESGAHAGLQTAAQVSAAMARKQAAERAEAAEASQAAGSGETIFRDASGRIINVAMKRAEARRKAEEEERKKKAEAEAARGDVQRAQKEGRKQALEEARYMPVARYADDAELNEELMERGRWNDPAAGFLEKKKAGKSVTGKPLYQGAAPPNRYGIRPGHRWDGVDRSNGFENKWFAARNRKQNIRDLQFQWQMDE